VTLLALLQNAKVSCVKGGLKWLYQEIWNKRC